MRRPGRPPPGSRRSWGALAPQRPGARVEASRPCAWAGRRPPLRARVRRNRLRRWRRHHLAGLAQRHLAVRGGQPARQQGPAATRPGGAGARSPTSTTTPRRSRAPGSGPPDDPGSRARSDPVPPVDQLVAADHDRLIQAVDAHVLDQLVELPAGHDREHRRRMDRVPACRRSRPARPAPRAPSPSLPIPAMVSRGTARGAERTNALPQLRCQLRPAGTGGGRRRVGAHVSSLRIEGARRDPIGTPQLLSSRPARGGTRPFLLPPAVCGPAASGACRPSSPARAVPGREVGLHAQSSHPPPEREKSTRSERRQTPAGRTPPPAGPGTAVRPPSRGREGRRPRNGRRTPALATAHPAGLKNGPARRVRLSQIPASRTAQRRALAAAERPGRRISAFHLDGAGRKRGFAAGRHFLLNQHPRARRGHRSLRPAGLNAGAENHRLVD